MLGNRIEWSVGALAPGSSGAVQYTLRLHADLTGGRPIRNLVTIAATEPDTNFADNLASSELAVGGLPDLSLTKTVATSPDPPGAGASATYTLTWQNSGKQAIFDAVRKDYDAWRRCRQGPGQSI